MPKIHRLRGTMSSSLSSQVAKQYSGREELARRETLAERPDGGTRAVPGLSHRCSEAIRSGASVRDGSPGISEIHQCAYFEPKETI